MYYVREDSRTCCKNDSEHIKILDQSLGVLSTQILLIPRHAKQFWVSDEDKLALCRKLILHLDFRPKHMLKQLPTIVKRSSFCKSQEHCWEHVLHCYIPFILFWSRFSNYKLINDAVPCHLSGNKLIRTIALWQWECVYSSISTDATSIINCMYGILK